MISADDFQALSRRAESARAARERAAGAAETLLEQMRAYGVDTPAAADAEIARLDAEEAELAERYLREKAEFEREYAEELNGG